MSDDCYLFLNIIKYVKLSFIRLESPLLQSTNQLNQIIFLIVNYKFILFYFYYACSFWSPSSCYLSYNELVMQYFE